MTLVRAIVLSAALLAGCETEPSGSDFYEDGHPQQKYTYKEVRKAVKKLEVGTPRYEVMLLLGSPAEMRGNTWIYVPEKPEFLVPQDRLEVRFQGGRYVSHEFKPIVFGQTRQ